MATSLTTAERRERSRLMTEIDRNTEASETANLKVGRALRKLRDKKLYRETHPTFELFVREHWGLSRARAYQLIGLADTHDALSTSGRQNPPASERAARELKGTPAQKRKQWKAAVKQHGPKPTAAQTRATRQSHQSKAAQAPKGNLPSDPQVVAWVERQRAAGHKRDEIIEMSKRGDDRWPRPGIALSKATMTEIERAVKHGTAPTTTPPSVRKAKAKEAASRMEQIAAQLEVKNKAVQQLGKVNQIGLELSATLYEIDLTALTDLNDKFVNRFMDSAFDNLVNLHETIQLRMGDFVARASDKAVRDKVAKMRDPSGRTGPEHATACAIADEIERKHFGPRQLSPPGA